MTGAEKRDKLSDLVSSLCFVVGSSSRSRIRLVGQIN